MVFNNLSDLDKFIVARWSYSVGEPIISDPEYQVLLEMIQVKYPDNPYVNRTWSDDPCPSELLNKIGRSDLINKVILLDKTSSIKSLGSFSEIRLELSGINEPATLSLKHDGWNIQANYYNGELINIHTRGRASDAVDVSRLNDRLPSNIPVKGRVKVVLELTCPKRNFPFCAKMFGNVTERSAVSTLLARPEYHHLLEMHAIDIHGITVSSTEKFNVLQEWGFAVPIWYEVITYDDLLFALEQLNEDAITYDSPTDGVVYDGNLRRALRVLYWEEPIYKSFITGYSEKYAANRISPSIVIEPILRKGVTQRKINITNWERIIKYNLRPGAPVAFKIASDSNAVFLETETRLLHETWYGRWTEYHEMIQENERLTKEKWLKWVSA